MAFLAVPVHITTLWNLAPMPNPSATCPSMLPTLPQYTRGNACGDSVFGLTPITSTTSARSRAQTHTRFLIFASTIAACVGSPLATLYAADVVPANQTAVMVPIAPAISSSLRIQPSSIDELARLTNDYRQHVNVLADPFMEGRAPGTKGNRVSADYLEFHFKRFGLTPAFPVGDAPRTSYRQEFEAPPSSRPGDSVVKDREVLTATGPKGEVSLIAGKDFEATGGSASATFTGPVSFVGYSIVNGDDDYSTYPEGTADDVLKDSIAMLFRFEPMNDQGKSAWATERWSNKAALDPKVRAAVSRGAKAIIIVNPPGAQDDRSKQLDGWAITSRQKDVPIVIMSAEGADALVRGLAGSDAAPGETIMAMRQRADAKGGIETLAGSVTLDVALKRVPLMTDNVGAILAGKGTLANEIVVIGAHYDHVGYGFFGSRDGNAGRGKIHPGADDNASGTAGLLIAAQQLANWYKDLPDNANARSILFVGFCAEESGLNGSQFYVKHPIQPLETHQAMINLDMIGRLREGKVEVYGVGTGVGLAEWLKPYFDASTLTVAPKISGLGPSDHASFVSAKIPVLFVHTGLHAEYHRVVDTADTINSEGGVQVSDFAARIAWGLATRPDKLQFTSANGRASARDSGAKDSGNEQVPNALAQEGAPAEPNADLSAPVAGQSMSRVGVRFGISPGDYTGTEPGVLVGEVQEGLPAAKAGLKSGDRMIKWNDKDLTDVESWMPLLAEHKPGDKVSIIYVRDGKEVTAIAELVARSTSARE